MSTINRTKRIIISKWLTVKRSSTRTIFRPDFVARHNRGRIKEKEQNRRNKKKRKRKLRKVA